MRTCHVAVVLSVIWGAGLCDGAEPTGAPKGAAMVAKLPLVFVENRGQWDTPARLVARRGPMTARFETDAIILQLEKREPNDEAKGVVVRLAFEGAREDVAIIGEERQAGRYNFFLGNDRSKWRSEVPAYSQVLYRGLYEGIDLRVRDEAGRLEYDLLLGPGADLSQVVICCEGIDGLDIDADGSLVMQTALGPITQTPPIAWYEVATGARQPVECRFCTFDEKRFGFDVPELDLNHILVIDPGLEWSTFLGGALDDDGVWKVAVDESGIVTAAGWTLSSDFPTTPGAYDEGFNGPYNFFVARLDPAQVGRDQLVWSTFVGGTGHDDVYDLSVDALGAVTVVGPTSSRDFPVTDGAYDTTHNGSFDAFALRLSADGSNLSWSTFLGSSGNDWAADVDVDEAGTVTVGGFTTSPLFPTTPGAFDEDFNGGQDAFVARLDPSQTGEDQLVWSTFLGGSGIDGILFDPFSFDVASMGVVVDQLGQVTVSGGTNSTNFSTTKGAYDTTYNGNADGFVSRLSADGSNLIWSTFLGGSSGREPGIALAVDANGVITTAGYTWSSNFPTTPGAYNTSHGASNDGFVARLDPSLPAPDQLVYSTFIGGDSFDPVLDIALDESGVVTAAGYTNSTNFPTTLDAKDRSDNPGIDGYLFRLNPDVNGEAALLHSTYLGGSANDLATGLALHGPDDVIVSGFTLSADFPVTSGAYDETYNDFQDAFLARLDLCPIDLDDDGEVGVTDLLALLAAWGTDPGGPPDFDMDGDVGVTDLLVLLGAWGPCLAS